MVSNDAMHIDLDLDGGQLCLKSKNDNKVERTSLALLRNLLAARSIQNQKNTPEKEETEYL